MDFTPLIPVGYLKNTQNGSTSESLIPLPPGSGHRAPGDPGALSPRSYAPTRLSSARQRREPAGTEALGVAPLLRVRCGLRGLLGVLRRACRAMHARPPVAGSLLVCPLCFLPSSPSASRLVLRSTGQAPTSGFSLCPLSSSLPRCHLSETFRNLTTLLKIAVHTPPLVCLVLIRFIFLYSIYHVLAHYIIAVLFYCLSPLPGV